MSKHYVARFGDRTSPPHIVTLTLLAGIAALNMSIFLPSLNAMATHFDTSYATMQLSVSAYLACTAVLQVAVGPISDKFGRRKLVLFTLGVFILASLGALFAPSVEVFLAFRMLQAAVATCMVLSRAIVRDLVPQDQAASMLGYVTMGMALVPMVGPMIGGLLDQLYGWQASFAFLILAGLGVWVLAYFDQGETLPIGGMSFREQLRDYPGLLTSVRFWGYTMAAAFGSGAFFAMLGGGSFVASEVFGLSPLLTGMCLGAPAIGYATGNGISGRFSVKYGIDRMALIGTIIAAMALSISLIVTLSGVHSPLNVFGFCVFMGLGNGLLMPNATAGMLSVRPHLAGTASGLGAAIMIAGGAGLSQIGGAVLSIETGSLPLQLLMTLVSVLAMVTMILVIRRARAIGA